MRHLLVIMRYSILKSYECRLIMLNFIIVLIKSLRDLSLKSFDEYISIQYAPVIEFFKY